MEETVSILFKQFKFLSDIHVSLKLFSCQNAGHPIFERFRHLQAVQKNTTDRYDADVKKKTEKRAEKTVCKFKNIVLTVIFILY